jgi:hypothetical protein
VVLHSHVLAFEITRFFTEPFKKRGGLALGRTGRHTADKADYRHGPLPRALELAGTPISELLDRLPQVLALKSGEISLTLCLEQLRQCCCNQKHDCALRATCRR